MKQDTTVRGKAEINEVIAAFTKFTGLEPTPKLRQRQYASTLTKILGDKTMDVVNYAISIQGDKYAPMISSPKDLYYKVNDVMAYAKRQQTNEGGLVVL